MRIIEIKSRNPKFPRSNKVYEPSDYLAGSGIQAPIPTIPNRNLRFGDWIEDINGLVAQVLYVSTIRNPKYMMLIQTCFGRDALIHEGKKCFFLNELNYLRDRVDFGSLRRKPKEKLNMRDRLFLRYCLSMDQYSAYKAVYGGTPTKNNISYKVNTLLKLDETQVLIMSELKKLIAEKGMTNTSYYVDKIASSLEGTIKNSTQLEMLKLVAIASANKDAIKLVAPDRVEDDSSFRGRIDQAEEVEATEVAPEQLESITLKLKESV